MDDFITFPEALKLTRYKNTSQLRRAAERFAAGDKTGLRAQKLNPRLWVTKEPWVRTWEARVQYSRGRPLGSKDKQPRTRRQSRTPKEEQL